MDHCTTPKLVPNESLIEGHCHSSSLISKALAFKEWVVKLLLVNVYLVLLKSNLSPKLLLEQILVQFIEHLQPQNKRSKGKEVKLKS